MKITPAQHAEACNYPGRLDEAEVELQLTKYLIALGVTRKIERLAQGWRLEDHPSLEKYAKAVLDDWVKRNPAVRVAARDARDALDALDALAARDARDARDALDALAARDARDARDALAARDARDARDARAARAARDARAALAALDARDARDARDALAARDARDALDALDALAARDALDAITSLQRFAAWCIQSNGWGWWRFDISWVSVTAFGATTKAVKAWSEPLLEAFVAGCWMLHWTEDTLYWVSKPTVHKETIPGGRRLHNDKYAALESDVENLYFWHGVLVPAFVVVRPDWITIKHIETEANAEVRRVMVERYGEARYISDSGLKPVAHDSFGELFRKNFTGDMPLVYVKVMNSTPEPDGSIKPYFLSVNPQHYGGEAGKKPHAAIASTWRTAKDGKELFFKRYEEYRPGIET